MSWFPIDPASRVEATYTPFDKPKIVDVASLVGDSDKTTIPGLVKFRLKGQEYALEPFAEPDDPQFWFVFRDLTSQKETYPAARFLYAPAPVNGKMVLTGTSPYDGIEVAVTVEDQDLGIAGHNQGDPTSTSPAPRSSPTATVMPAPP